MYFKFGRPYITYNILSYDMVATPGFEGVAFPMVRRVFARLLADDIVSVQAMAAPVGILHYMTIECKINVFKFGRIWKQR